MRQSKSELIKKLGITCLNAGEIILTGCVSLAFAYQFYQRFQQNNTYSIGDIFTSTFFAGWCLTCLIGAFSKYN